MAYQITKRYGHDVGLSCAFRQWRAYQTHCSKIHGYALAFEFKFEGPLDERNWVISFGDLKWLKAWLQASFDHTVVLASDDPLIGQFREMDKLGALRLVELPSVGCEMFAKHAFKFCNTEMKRLGYTAQLVSVSVSEHGANTATYIGTPRDYT